MRLRELIDRLEQAYEAHGDVLVLDFGLATHLSIYVDDQGWIELKEAA